MAGFVATLYTINGTIILVDAENRTDKISGIYKINEQNVAIIFFELQAGIDFCKEHLKKFSTTGQLNDIIKEANQALQKTVGKYKGKPFSMVFASATTSDHVFPYYAIWIENDVPKGDFVPSVGVYSSLYQDLGQYIVSKTYSKYMSLDEAIGIMGYILLQCNKTLRTENFVDMITLSENGIEKINDKRLKEIITTAESCDHNLKKDFSDFFINYKEKDK